MKYNEMNHLSHPEHKLKFDYTEHPFKCDGCKEIGIGSHYKCCNDDNCSNTICDYDLHLHCAIPSPSISHPFYTKCQFQFMSRPPGNIQRYCNACERDVTGFVYHCRSCGFDLHPCCAKLPMVLHDGEVKLYLHRKVSTPCHRCGRKGRSIRSVPHLVNQYLGLLVSRNLALRDEHHRNPREVVDFSRFISRVG